MDFPIHKELASTYDKKVIIELTDGSTLEYDNILEFSNSKYHLCLVLRGEDNVHCTSINIPKDNIMSASRYVHNLDRYLPIKLNTRRMSKKVGSGVSGTHSDDE